jgi:hypothetical protein
MGLLAAGLFAAALAGCDLAGYDARLHTALKTSADRAAFDQALFPDQYEIKDAKGNNVGVSLRLPKSFDNNAKSLPAKDERAQIPALPLPGLSFAMERQLNDAGNKWLPAYVYFAVVPKAEQKPEALQAAVAQAAAAAGGGGTWSDASLKTPEGSMVTFKRLRIDGQLPFLNLQKKPPAPVKAAGRLDIYLVDAGDNSVLIAWRAPKAQAENHKFEAATEAAMGTVQVTATAAAAAGKGG